MALIDEIQGFPRHLSQHVGGFIITEGRLDELVPRRKRDDGGPHRHLPGTRTTSTRSSILKVDILALGHADLHPQGLRPPRQAPPPALHPRDPAARGPGDLRHALPRRLAWGLPGGIPRADELPAPDAAAMLLRPRHPGRDHPPRPDPGRHGPPLPAPPERRRRQVSFPSDALGRCSARPSACRSSRNRRCRSPSSARASRPMRPTASAARSPPSRSTGPSANSATASSAACWPTATTQTSPSAALPRSKASAATASPKATPPASRSSSMPRPGSSATTPASSPARLLNSQPMGFYAPAQIVRDAREHGVTVLPVCIQASHWDNRMEWLDRQRSGPGTRPPPRLPPDPGDCRGGGALDHRRARQRLPDGRGRLAPRRGRPRHADPPRRSRRLRRPRPRSPRRALVRRGAGGRRRPCRFSPTTWTAKASPNPPCSSAR